MKTTPIRQRSRKQRTFPAAFPLALALALGAAPLLRVPARALVPLAAGGPALRRAGVPGTDRSSLRCEDIAF